MANRPPCGKPPSTCRKTVRTLRLWCFIAMRLRRLVAARGLKIDLGLGVLDPGTLARARSGRQRLILPESEAARWWQARARGDVLTTGSGRRQERACAWQRRSWWQTGRSRGLEPGGRQEGIWGLLELDGAGKVGG
jgi:hypothetical protein